MKVIGIIPARAGSKGVLQKNLCVINGEPLIHYTLKAASQSTSLTDIYVSSDSDIILQTANKYGVLPIKRPQALAQDDSSIIPVIQHVLDAANREGKNYEAIILLQPTSPLREGFQIDEVVNLLFLDDLTQSVISVCKMDDLHPCRMYKKDTEDYLHPLMPDMEETRRQDLPPVFHRNGSIYAVKTAAFQKHNSMMVKPSKAYVMDKKYLINIDDERDLIIAEALVKKWKMGKL